MKLEWKILYWIHNKLSCPFLDFIIPKITILGTFGIIWNITAIILIFTKQYRKGGIILLIGLVTGVLIGNLILKNLIARQRPCWIDKDIKLLVKNPEDYSFPSCHTLSSVIAATILTLISPAFALGAIPVALLISFSRLYLFVHYLSDILIASAMGVVIGLAAFYIGNIFL